MSHEIETMAYSGEVPWHKLGKAVTNDLSPKQMLQAAGCDWTVEKVPATAIIDGKSVRVGWNALVRSSDHSILDIVSDDWIPNQNEDAFQFFNEFVEMGDMSMETAGSLDEGRIVWALARIKDSFEVFGGDQVDSFLLFTNPHRFGRSIDVRFTPIRVVCNNTMTLALNHKSMRQRTGEAVNTVRVSHRKAFDTDRVKEMLGIAHHKMGVYKQTAEFLGSKRYTEQLLKKYMGEVFPKINVKEHEEHTLSLNAERAISWVERQPGAEFAEGTWWSAFNAATFFVDHIQGRTDATRLRSAWYGQGRQTKINALNTAIKFAKEEITA